MPNQEYFVNRVTADINEIKGDVKEIRELLNELQGFKIQVITACGVVSIVGTIAVDFVFRLFSK